MKNNFKTRLVALVLTVVAASVTASAQRVRTISDPDAAQTQSTVLTPAPPPAPPTVKAKYEGGIVGYKKSDGTLNFDDANTRLLFRDKNQKELFSVPYKVVMVAYADTQSKRPIGATVAGSVPLPYGANIPALFIRKKYRYLILHYNDPDTNAQGTASFKLDNKEILASVLSTLAKKAELTQRGDAFVRRRNPMTTSGATMQTTVPVPPPDKPQP